MVTASPMGSACGIRDEKETWACRKAPGEDSSNQSTSLGGNHKRRVKQGRAENVKNSIITQCYMETWEN